MSVQIKVAFEQKNSQESSLYFGAWLGELPSDVRTRKEITENAEFKYNGKSEVQGFIISPGRGRENAKEGSIYVPNKGTIPFFLWYEYREDSGGESHSRARAYCG